ncbi:MAG: type I glutamate--ammonia ligase [Chlorobiota bacterium]|jgi:glutamine synthetase|nr:type I glutamate--ammonia ligase [Chlorobiota bacterium]QQS67740.1 MAG: type I glutamate--ammonia ligase [Chlorobiota bacterium]
MNKTQVLKLAKQHNVKFVNLQFTDIVGTLKAVTIPVWKLEDAIESNVWFDGSSIEGFTRVHESDMFLKLDLETFAVIPWTLNSTNGSRARVICDVFMPDGSPFEGDPRGILKRQLERVKKMGYVFNVGPELEFFLLKKGADGKFTGLPHDQAGYFDQTYDQAMDIREEMTLALTAFNIDVEALHHEVAIGQHEIDFKYCNALAGADASVTLKWAFKNIAQKHDLHATFMPKPISGINGSGMHVHQSLFTNEGKNMMFDKKGTYSLSNFAQQFIAGQLHHIQALNAIINPTVNSYKRLVVGYEAPVNVAWGQKNRSVLIRVPRYTPGREKAVRVEIRCPDPAANPYLAFAALLAAGLDGIEKKMTPPDPVEDDLFHMTQDELKKRKIGSVAPTLYDALEALKKNDVIRGAIGDFSFSKFYEAKMKEWDEYRIHVSNWELEKYLEVH